MNYRKLFKSHAGTKENVTYRLIRNGQYVKAFFQENWLGRQLLLAFRRRWKQPIDENGQVKPGVRNYLAAYGLRIPFVTGFYTDELDASNLITNAGLALLASRCNGSGGLAAATYIATGTGTTAANAADTTLETEIGDSGLARAAATASRVTTSVTNDTARLQYTFSVSGTKAVTESGCLNAGSSGDLLNRQVFSAVNVQSGDSLQLTHNIQFATS